MQQLMDQQLGNHGLSLFDPPEGLVAVESSDGPLADGQFLTLNATLLPLGSWIPVPEGDHATMAMSMEWGQQIHAIMPAWRVSSPTTPPDPGVVDQQYTVPTTHWLQGLSTLGPNGFVVDSCESSLSRPASGPWINGEYLQPGASPCLLPSLKPQPGSTLFSTHWRHDAWIQPAENGASSTTEIDVEPSRKRRKPLHSDGERETRDGNKERRLTRFPDNEITQYLPEHAPISRPRLAQRPTPDKSQTIWPSTDSNTTDTTSNTDTVSPSNSHHHPASDTSPTSTTSPIFTAITTAPPPPQGPITTTTTTKPKRTRVRNRNRAAASRYRAKTQAASAQLEAAARAASARRQSLLARAGELRDEVLLLKAELLRHAGAGCECPLIRAYLERATEEAWAHTMGRRVSMSSAVPFNGNNCPSSLSGGRLGSLKGRGVGLEHEGQGGDEDGLLTGVGTSILG